MKAAVALVLLLNGVQVHLGAPALRVDGMASVPLRPICECVGLSVQATSDSSAVVVSGPRGQQWRVGLREHLTTARSLSGTKLDGVVYVPARALAEALGGSCRWDGAALLLDLQIPWQGGAPAVSLARLRGDALAWRGRVVEVTGRAQRGWATSGASSWDASGPTELDLGDGGRLLRVARPAGIELAAPPGERVTARGRAGLLSDGTPWVQASGAEGLGGSVALEVDREACEGGGEATIGLWRGESGPGAAGEPSLELLSPTGSPTGTANVRWSVGRLAGAWEGTWRVPGVVGRGASARWRLRAGGAEAEVRLEKAPAGGGRG
jgi:hypothetical protein